MALDLTKTVRVKIPKDTLINSAVAILSIVLVIILWALLVNPKISLMKELKRGIQSVSGFNEEEMARLTQKKSTLTQEKNKMVQGIASLKKELLQRKDISTILDKLILTARRRKLEFTAIKPLSKKESVIKSEGVTRFIREIPVSLELEAGFSEFLGFLWETEHSEQTFKITELSIEKNPQNPLRHKERLSISIYQLVEPLEQAK
ncbi:MAG: type 4a pilus biogenesis protein PilO [Candidatus Omnitrophota bacterium]|nr:MAG: type 4a pilus biogenesis protein PilO [Candidatus Omnitrophota bacterium]